MSLEALANRMGEATDRRGLLGKLGAAGLAAAAYLGVAAPAAQALCTRSGCDFCRCPTSCSYTCSWCWWGRCHTHSDGRRHRHLCCEGYGPVHPNYCSGQCSFGLNCSFFGSTGGC